VTRRQRTVRSAPLGRAVRLAALVALAVACSPTQRAFEFRQQSTTYAFLISSDPTPPRARERILYKVVVRDRKTGQPIEGGEGRIFATNQDMVTTWDSFTAGPEVGTYYANLNYIVAGNWPIAIQFRSDSTKPLERVDWVQDVREERATP
jgi:hypothetical protein